jgi:mevalonate kinase
VVLRKPGVQWPYAEVFVTVRKSKSAHHARSPYIDSCFDDMGVKGAFT